MALKALIGVGAGTVVFEDLAHCDAMFFGHNTGSNSPRLLRALQKAVELVCCVITFNPVRERGLEELINPQDQMIIGEPTSISHQYHQVKAGGDIAAIVGMCKHVLALDDAARGAGQPNLRSSSSAKADPNVNSPTQLACGPSGKATVRAKSHIRPLCSYVSCFLPPRTSCSSLCERVGRARGLRYVPLARRRRNNRAPRPLCRRTTRSEDATRWT